MSLNPRIFDSENLVSRLSMLARSGHLTPERLEATCARLKHNLREIRAEMAAEDREPAPAGLPLVAARFHGYLAVIDGGLR